MDRVVRLALWGFLGVVLFGCAVDYALQPLRSDVLPNVSVDTSNTSLSVNISLPVDISNTGSVSNISPSDGLSSVASDGKTERTTTTVVVRPIVHPILAERVRRTPTKKVDVVVQVATEDKLDEVVRAIEAVNGEVKGTFSVGDLITAQIDTNKIQAVAQVQDVVAVSPEFDYRIVLNESVPALGVDRVWNLGVTGTGVRVAILDTGVDINHDMLAGRIAASRSFVVDEDVDDYHGHGTHVAGIVAGKGRFTGVAPGADILNAKVLNKHGGGKTSQIISGINWAVEHGADIISMSFGGMYPEEDGPLAHALRETMERGIVVVAASGNCRMGCGGFTGVTFPASMREVIAVGAVDEQNTLAPFSSGQNFSDHVKPDFVAPGVRITSSIKNNGYREESGTSMSAPFFAGMVALVLEREQQMNQSEVQTLFKEHATDLGSPGKDSEYGWGLPNVVSLFGGGVSNQTIVNVTSNTTSNTTTNNTPVGPPTDDEGFFINLSSNLILRDFEDVRFLGVVNSTVAVNESISDMLALYETGGSTFGVREVLFNETFNLIDYIYVLAPLLNASRVSLNYSYVLLDGGFLWYNSHAAYIIQSANHTVLPALEHYAPVTGNLVGRDDAEQRRNLERLDKLSQQRLYTLPAPPRGNISDANNITAQYGASSCKKARDDNYYHLDWDDAESESFYTEGASNWYWTHTTKRGQLTFEIYDITRKDDLDLYVYDYLGTSEACRSERSSNDAEKCTTQKNSDADWGFCIKVVPYDITGSSASGILYPHGPSCNKGYTQYYCDRDERWGTYQKSDCSTREEKVQNCNDADTSGSWSAPYCSSGDITKSRTKVNGYCSSAQCRTESSTEYESVEDCRYGCAAGTSSCYECTSDSHCSNAQKCSNNKCVDKQCGDYTNNAGGCGYSDYWTGNTECKNSNPTLCDAFGTVYCWKYTDQCTTDEYCEDPWNGPAQCFAYECSLTSVAWDKATAKVGESVGITAQGEHCTGKSVTFDVQENDCWGVLNASSVNGTVGVQGVCNDVVNANPPGASFSNGRATSSWIAEYQHDGVGDPEYYVHTYYGGQEKRSADWLVVSCVDGDGDGSSTSGGECGAIDCRDTDAQVYPGASEICDEKDNNCVDGVDEGFNLNTDKNNCGTCGNVCGGGRVCSSGTCVASCVPSTEICDTQDNDCDGQIDEGFDLDTDSRNCGSCGNACGAQAMCAARQCVSTRCSDYPGNLLGACTSQGAYKKENNKIWACSNVASAGNVLCWKEHRSLGDYDFCDYVGCSYGEYDCDADSACASELQCLGPLFDISSNYFDGCCSTGDEWDTRSKSCKKPDGSACTSNNQCITGTCSQEKCGPVCTPSTEICDGKDNDCDGTVDEGIDITRDAQYCGACGVVCSEGQACSKSACVANTCAGYPPNAGACSSYGLYKKESNKIYHCENVGGDALTVHCWKEQSSLGARDYCDYVDCTYGEYDCDEDAACAQGLVCTGPVLDLTPSSFDGCCSPGDQWNNGLCRKQDGGSCTLTNQCIGGYCVGGKCSSTSYFVGDKKCDAGETCSNSPKDCGLCNGGNCVNGELCNSSYCVHDTCRATAFIVGDTHCDISAGENPENSQDCVRKLEVVEITEAPSSVTQGQQVTVKAKVRNAGTYNTTLQLEAGIVPDAWEGKLFEFGAQKVESAVKCCAGNSYYSAKSIMLGPQETETVTFTMTAPYSSSTDACSKAVPKMSAWDVSHTVVVGLYNRCGDAYVGKKTKDIKVQERTCVRHADCLVDEYCKYTGTSGLCTVKGCTDACLTKDQYFCSESSVYNCIDSDQNGCYEKTFVEYCNQGKICVPGKQTCDVAEVKAQLKIEEAEGVIRAQPGDKVTVYLTYVRQEQVELDYPTDVLVLETNACRGAFLLTGSTTCTFRVRDTATKGDAVIRLKNGGSRTLTIVPDADVLVVTNKPKLLQRFQKQMEVSSLLRQIYEYAQSKDAIVYDMDDYISGHPWGDFSGYTEQWNNPSMKDNTYSLEVARFIREKCNGCKQTLVIGDDFVVPHYRRDIDMSMWFGLSRETDEIYSDVAYVGRSDKMFSEFEELFYQDKKFDGKKVLIVLPTTTDTAKMNEIERLKKFLEGDTIKAKVEYRDSARVTCNSNEAFTWYDGWTLVIIGNEETNRALRCMPFVTALGEGSGLDSVSIERNPWDPRAYAIVVNSENVEVLQILNSMLETGSYKDLHTHLWLYARTAGNVAAGAAVGIVIIGSAGTATPVLLGVAIGANVAADAVDGAECLEFKGSECVEFVVGVVLPFSLDKIAKPLLKSGINVLGPRLKPLWSSLGDGLDRWIVQMGKKGQLNPGSGLDKFTSKLRSYLPKGTKGQVDEMEALLKRAYKQGDEFGDFVNKVAKNNPDEAIAIVKIADATKATPEQLSIIAKKGYVPANMFVKSIDNLGPEFKYVTDTALRHSDGTLKPAFRGINFDYVAKLNPNFKEFPSDPLKMADLLDQQLKFSRGEKGYDIARQIGTGRGADQAVKSFTNDFGVGAWYTGSGGKDFNGAVLVYDKRFTSLVDSQKTMGPLGAAMPKAKIKLEDDSLVSVEGVNGNSIINNELSMIGSGKIEHAIGWYKTTVDASEKQVATFVPNPRYIGNMNEWGHVKTVASIKETYVKEGISNWEKIRATYPDIDHDLLTGNTNMWPKDGG